MTARKKKKLKPRVLKPSPRKPLAKPKSPAIEAALRNEELPSAPRHNFIRCSAWDQFRNAADTANRKGDHLRKLADWLEKANPPDEVEAVLYELSKLAYEGRLW